MGVWAASATMMLLPPPDATHIRHNMPNTFSRQADASAIRVPVGPNALPVIGANRLFTKDEFNQLWSTFFSSPINSPDCGKPLDLKGSDRKLIAEDLFLVKLRGFRESICNPESWYISAMRIDPCRIRVLKENRSRSAIKSCSMNGKFQELRFVLQPVENTDRGLVFPDVALHVALSFGKFEQILKVWRDARPEKIVSAARRLGVWNDVALFLGGAGLERWTFSRVKFVEGKWQQDRLAHGGFHESLSDAEADGTSVQTDRPADEPRLSDVQLMNPMLINPLQGSCIQCHLADKNRPVRVFRQLGWGLSGEPVVSARVLKESRFSASELNIIGNGKSPKQR
ncbi:MAG: hypothetical protein ACO3A4_01120 [Silvanigrellaceae bacterium]